MGIHLAIWGSSSHWGSRAQEQGVTKVLPGSSVPSSGLGVGNWPGFNNGTMFQQHWLGAWGGPGMGNKHGGVWAHNGIWGSSTIPLSAAIKCKYNWELNVNGGLGNWEQGKGVLRRPQQGSQLESTVWGHVVGPQQSGQGHLAGSGNGNGARYPNLWLSNWAPGCVLTHWAQESPAWQQYQSTNQPNPKLFLGWGGGLKAWHTCLGR